MHNCLFKKKGLVTLCLLYNTQYVVVASWDCQSFRREKKKKEKKIIIQNVIQFYIFLLLHCKLTKFN